MGPKINNCCDAISKSSAEKALRAHYRQCFMSHLIFIECGLPKIEKRAVPLVARVCREGSGAPIFEKVGRRLVSESAMR